MRIASRGIVAKSSVGSPQPASPQSMMARSAPAAEHMRFIECTSLCTKRAVTLTEDMRAKLVNQVFDRPGHDLVDALGIDQPFQVAVEIQSRPGSSR